MRKGRKYMNRSVIGTERNILGKEIRKEDNVTGK
jgi:hypothetical protein